MEKYGFHGPSKVMWGKHNEIRDLFKRSFLDLDSIGEKTEIEAYINGTLNPLIEEVDGMVFKEEKILFPTSLEKLSVNDWVDVLRESDEIGYAFIEKPKETGHLVQDLKRVVVEKPTVREGVISLPTGELRLQELLGIANTLPVDITFVDRDDRVKYFSETKNRTFVRTKAVLGRKVQNCHPPQSVDVVEKILTSFKEGRRDVVDFWFNFQGREVFIRYFAVRDERKKYLGTLEVSQDITNIKKLQGEKRLLDERA